MGSLEDQAAELLKLVPWKTGEVVRQLKLAEQPDLPEDATVEVVVADVLRQRLVEANELAEEVERWVAWASRLRATLTATAFDEPYGRVRVDSVMRDCPLKVEGEGDGSNGG